MKFSSLNKRSPSVNYEDAIFLGFAPDGGLYVPDGVPQFSQHELAEIPHMSLHDIASLTLCKWLGDELTKNEIEQIVKAAISFPLPLVEVGGHKVFELYHGPTLSFKDIPARILAHTIKTYKQKRKNKPIHVLLTTNDDTGAAVTHGFSEINDARIVVLFPSQHFDESKKDLLLRSGGSVLAIEIDGTYDQCQQLAKRALSDPDLQHVELTSANSISVGRLIPQIIYYVYLYALMYPNNPTLVMPADNLGNACTALLAKLMGIPFEKIILATNDNAYLITYVSEGSRLKPISDIDQYKSKFGNRMPKNFPRILHLCGYSHKKFTDIFDVYNMSFNKALHLTQALWTEYNYLVDPHTSIAWLAADSLNHSNKHIVITAVSSPVKYVDELKRNAGITLHKTIVEKELGNKKTRTIMIPNDYKMLKNLLMREFVLT